jgi:hypothetical protein
MPAIVHVHNLVVPDPPDVCELAIFPVAAVPYALGALEYRIPRYVWAAESYLRGVQLVRSMQLAILCGGLKEITERQDALYRLLDTALYGRVYNVVTSEPLVVEPQIWPTHELAIEDPDSLFGRAEDLRQLLQNGLNGTETPHYDRANGVRDLLEQIKTALEASDELDDDMLAKLAEIALALA